MRSNAVQKMGKIVPIFTLPFPAEAIAALAARLSLTVMMLPDTALFWVVFCFRTAEDGDRGSLFFRTRFPRGDPPGMYY